jgi:hypothetical protein
LSHHCCDDDGCDDDDPDDGGADDYDPDDGGVDDDPHLQKLALFDQYYVQILHLMLQLDAYEFRANGCILSGHVRDEKSHGKISSQ